MKARPLRLNKCTEIEIDKLIQKIKPKRSCGMDNISNYLMKELTVGLRTPLCKLVNKSLDEGIFPESLKIAKIKPLHKGGIATDMNNYRPISLLPVFSKIFEKVVLNRIQHHMKSTNQYSKLQFGFREGSSTIHACEKFSTEILKCFNNKSILASVFIDLKKAFDTVSKDILLEKLRFYGLDSLSLRWFDSYLSNRVQYTCIEKHESQYKVLAGCLAQGSILAPELFLYMVNDMKRSLRYCQCILFADDTTIYLVGTNIKFLRQKIQFDMQNLYDWLNCNKLYLNISKTKIMLFSEKLLHYNSFDIVVNNQTIEVVNKFKFLGIVFDHKMTFEHHLSSLCNRLKYYLYMLKQIKSYMSKTSLLLYYYGYIHSRLQYGLLIWYPLLSQNNKKRLHSVLNRVYKQIPDTSQILQLPNLNKFETLKLTYQFINKSLPDGILTEMTCNTHNYNS